MPTPPADCTKWNTSSEQKLAEFEGQEWEDRTPWLEWTGAIDRAITHTRFLCICSTYWNTMLEQELSLVHIHFYILCKHNASCSELHTCTDWVQKCYRATTHSIHPLILSCLSTCNIPHVLQNESLFFCWHYRNPIRSKYQRMHVYHRRSILSMVCTDNPVWFD